MFESALTGGIGGGVGERGTREISIVDDDASLRRVLTNLFVQAGFRVEAFASAEAFQNSIHPQNTAYLVLDLRLPGMSGLEFLGHLAATRAQIPVVILTAHGDEVMRRRCLEASAIAVLPKPFDRQALLARSKWPWESSHEGA